jgi:hypothetical protein
MEENLVLADPQGWAQLQFSQAQLGDVRRTRRLVMLAAMMAGNSSGSIPQQTGGGADMKAAYRLFAADGVTHTAVCQPHFESTRQAAGMVPLVFLVQDTMILNFTSHSSCEGLGPIANREGLRGLHQQNVLAVDPVTRRPLGLIYQNHYCGQERPEGWHDRRGKRRAVPPPQRESHWWIESITSIGQPPPGVRWVHVGDRGEDIFGVYDEARRQGADWLIRVSQDRRVITPEGEGYLMPYARGLASRTQRVISIRRKPQGGLEEVRLCVSGGPVTLRPSHNDPYYRDRQPISCWVARIWEDSPPPGAQPLEWILCTSLSCQKEQALGFAAEGYGLRWLIEEFHKCQKTGCQVEMRRLETVDRLEPLIGLLSVLAVALLQLKYVARDQPRTPAREVVGPAMADVMARYLRRPAKGLTTGEFWRGIGRLGGHPGRKGDGPSVGCAPGAGGKAFN